MDIAADLIGSIDETKACFAWDGSTSGSCLRKPGTSNQRFEPRIWPVVCPFIAPNTAGAFPFRACALFPEKVSGREPEPCVLVSPVVAAYYAFVQAPPVRFVLPRLTSALLVLALFSSLLPRLFPPILPQNYLIHLVLGGSPLNCSPH